MLAVSEARAVGLADVRGLLAGIVRVVAVAEALTALALFPRFWLGYDVPPGRAAYLAVFHAVSAFNNAGFALWSDSLTRFAGDPWVLVPVALAVVAGGLGFPVWVELRRHLRRPERWSLHTRMTVAGTAALLVLGAVFVTASEWGNPATLGGDAVGAAAARRPLPGRDAAHRRLQRASTSAR